MSLIGKSKNMKFKIPIIGILTAVALNIFPSFSTALPLIGWSPKWQDIKFVGTPTVQKTTKIINLNADTVDGKDASEFADLSENEVITGNWENLTYPWADNEIDDNITINNTTSITTDGAITAGGSSIITFIPSGGKITTTSNGDVDIVPNGTGKTTIGDGGTTDYMAIANNGEIALHGNARIVRHAELDPADFKLGGVSDPTSDLEGIFMTLDFADGTHNETFCSDIVPFRWDSSTDVEVEIDWFADSDASAKHVVWCIDYFSIGDGDTVRGLRGRNSW